MGKSESDATKLEVEGAEPTRTGRTGDGMVVDADTPAVSTPDTCVRAAIIALSESIRHSTSAVSSAASRLDYEQSFVEDGIVVLRRLSEAQRALRSWEAQLEPTGEEDEFPEAGATT